MILRVWLFHWTYDDEGCYIYLYMGVSLNGGTPKSSILTGFSIINHPFWGTTIFENTRIYIYTIIHPLRLTWNLRIHPWKRKKSSSKPIIFRLIFVNLPGCMFYMNFSCFSYLVSYCLPWVRPLNHSIFPTSDHLIYDNDQYQFHHHHDLPWKILGGPMKKGAENVGTWGWFCWCFLVSPKKGRKQKDVGIIMLISFIDCFF